MQKIRINKRENILQESGDFMFKIHLTISREIPEISKPLSIDYTVEFLNNGKIKDVNNINGEDYRDFIIYNIHNKLTENWLEIDNLFNTQIVT